MNYLSNYILRFKNNEEVLKKIDILESVGYSYPNEDLYLNQSCFVKLNNYLSNGRHKFEISDIEEFSILIPKKILIENKEDDKDGYFETIEKYQSFWNDDLHLEYMKYISKDLQFNYSLSEDDISVKNILCQKVTIDMDSIKNREHLVFVYHFIRFIYERVVNLNLCNLEDKYDSFSRKLLNNRELLKDEYNNLLSNFFLSGFKQDKDQNIVFSSFGHTFTHRYFKINNEKYKELLNNILNNNEIKDTNSFFKDLPVMELNSYGISKEKKIILFEEFKKEVLK